MSTMPEDETDALTIAAFALAGVLYAGAMAALAIWAYFHLASITQAEATVMWHDHLLWGIAAFGILSDGIASDWSWHLMDKPWPLKVRLRDWRITLHNERQTHEVR